MKKTHITIFYSSLFFMSLYFSCAGSKSKNTKEQVVKTSTDSIILPAPYETKSSMNFCKVIGWENGSAPIAPQGFKVEKYADSLRSARWMYILPNGDVLVSQANSEVSAVKKAGADLAGISKAVHLTESPNKITLLRDADKDGIAEFRSDFLTGLNQPFGMLLMGNSLYVAVTDGLWVFPYNTGETHISAAGKRILDLPAGGYNHHWTRNIVANKRGTKIYVSVGSSSNVAEYGPEVEMRRACILEINPDGIEERVYAAGLRNPVGMDWDPVSHTLWTAVNERDKLGDELVPDYATGVKEGGFYGWPYAYFGPNPDPRIEDKYKRPDLVAKSIVPDVSLGAHTASLGLAFYTGRVFPMKYLNGMFIAQHGSWNRKVLSGYKIVFIPFNNGRPSGPPEDFLTGFIADLDKSTVHGRPVGITMMSDGSMLLADDGSDMIWRISYKQ